MSEYIFLFKKLQKKLKSFLTYNFSLIKTVTKNKNKKLKRETNKRLLPNPVYSTSQTSLKYIYFSSASTATLMQRS